MGALWAHEFFPNNTFCLWLIAYIPLFTSLRLVATRVSNHLTKILNAGVAAAGVVEGGGRGKGEKGVVSEKGAEEAAIGKQKEASPRFFSRRVLGNDGFGMLWDALGPSPPVLPKKRLVAVSEPF